MNIIWRLATGHRFEYDDGAAKEAIQHMEAFTMEKTLGIMAGVSYAKYFPPFQGIYSNIKTHMEKFKSQLLTVMYEGCDEDDSTYVHKFLAEQQAGKNSARFTEEQLITSLFDFFTGGSGTMSKTLSFCFLYLLHYPEMQEKIRLEVNSALQENNQLTINMADGLPWTQAFILEVQRLSSVLPICPPRQVSADIEICGCKLYKGQRVQLNLYAMHRNEGHWGPDAAKFRPQRFLDEQGNVMQDDWLQPFGYGNFLSLHLQVKSRHHEIKFEFLISGKRKCLGEAVAKTTIVLLLANLVKDFQFDKVDNGKSLPDTEPVGGLTLMPQDFEIQVKTLFTAS